MSSLFALINGFQQSVHDIEFFTTVELARKALRKKAEKLRHKLGCRNFELREDSYTFTMGWEETRVSCFIVELEVDKD